MTDSKEVAKPALDTKAIFEKALNVFSKQAEAGIDNDGASTMASIELAKAKANSFLDAVSNVLAIKHEMDIVEASDAAFKRRDELDMLNILRQQCAVQAKASLKVSEYINDSLNKAIDTVITDDLDANAILGLLDYAASNTQKVITSAEKLIKLERMSGNRQWGKRDIGQANITYIQGLDQSINTPDHIGNALAYFKSRNNAPVANFTPRKLSIEEVS